MVQKECKKYSSARTKKLWWSDKAKRAIIKQIMVGGVTWLPKIVKVIEQPKQILEHGYETICKVKMARVVSIPNDIGYVEKHLKVEDKKQKHIEMLLEALACRAMHLGVIKISFLNPHSMDKYAL